MTITSADKIAQFIAKWSAGGSAYGLNERAGAQQHFIELCEVLQVPTPTGGGYEFEKGITVLGGARGYADVSKQGFFAWEYKAPGRSLEAALKQLMTYALALANPPLLVVSDRLRIEIHTHFNGTPSERHVVLLEQLGDPAVRERLRRVFVDPESFRPRVSSRQITHEAAQAFAQLAEQFRGEGVGSLRVAHFLTQCVFCLFAEDVGLLPGEVFTRLVNHPGIRPERVQAGLAALFEVMRGGGLFGADQVPWFNGGLFAQCDIPEMTDQAVATLREASAMDWSAIDVAILGTLFERGLDPAKRRQLGAHYTDPATIAKLIEPVITQPLRREWDQIRERIAQRMASSKKRGDRPWRDAQAAYAQFLEKLRDFRILDPACGSGNFLYLALRALKDMEHLANLQAEALGLPRQIDSYTGPANTLGIEVNDYAAELARVTIWIGELQWRVQHGYPMNLAPVLEPLDQIACRDAVLAEDGSRARWPAASVIVGNPPFIGNKRMRAELGDEYVRQLRSAYEGIVPGAAEFVCYWFAQGLQAVRDGASAVGLVATQSIRRGANRAVLDAIVQDSRIYDAWSDQPWVNEGAAVRVSMVVFGAGDAPATLDGQLVQRITADLASRGAADLTAVSALPENAGVAFQGTTKVGAFEIDGALARTWLALPNPHGKPNSDVLRPWANGQSLSARPGEDWIIDFGVGMPEHEAALYEAPFAHLVQHVRAARLQNKRELYRRIWWQHAEARPGLRRALAGMRRYIATPRVAKHRYFVWMHPSVLPDGRLCAIARDDDFTFGVLSSRVHEVWAVANASMHGVGNDPTYNGGSCFETFAFPRPNAAARQAIEDAARRLYELRCEWLNPTPWVQASPEVTPIGLEQSPYPPRIRGRAGHEAELAQRTLTKLYNARPDWLVGAQDALDGAVAAAYGWESQVLREDGEILLRLCVLNRERRQEGAPA